MNIQKELRPILEETRKNSFKSEYQEGIKDPELVGLVVSKFFEWDTRIIDAFQNALEDANFHSFNDKIGELREKENL